MRKQNSRDTQFAGFAKMLLNDIMRSNAVDIVDVQRFWRDEDIAEVEQIIARRAYDLAHHIIEHVEISAIDMLSIDECVERIPDMDEWPEER